MSIGLNDNSLLCRFVCFPFYTRYLWSYRKKTSCLSFLL